VRTQHAPGTLVGSALLLGVAAFIALASSPARSATSSFPKKTVGARVELSVRDVTPPEDVGRRPVVEVTGRVVTKNRKVHRGCRAERGPEIVVGPHGPGNPAGKIFDLHPTGRKGTFKGNFPLEYGGISEGQLYNGDVDFAGGSVPFTARVARQQKTVPGGGPFGTLAKCKPATSPMVALAIPPAEQ
jgi:hypothetical protein